MEDLAGFRGEPVLDELAHVPRFAALLRGGEPPRLTGEHIDEVRARHHADDGAPLDDGHEALALAHDDVGEFLDAGFRRQHADAALHIFLQGLVPEAVGPLEAVCASSSPTQARVPGWKTGTALSPKWSMSSSAS